ncbi:MAG: redox-sensing transcriptional repressor Rex [Thermoanaerobaculia bacterium]
MSRPSDVSSLTLHRLSVYLRSLQRLQEKGVTEISSHELARRFHLSPTQIRKDLAQFGEFGIRGVGYRVDHLEERLRSLLGLDSCRHMVLVGVGNLGRALLHHPGFNSSSFRFVGAVDSDPKKIGRRVGDLVVEPPEALPRLVERSTAEIGILAVPADAAAANAAALVAAGIRSILNFAPARLPERPGVRTLHVDLRISLEELGYFLLHTERGSRRSTR